MVITIFIKFGSDWLIFTDDRVITIAHSEYFMLNKRTMMVLYRSPEHIYMVYQGQAINSFQIKHTLGFVTKICLQIFFFVFGQWS